MMKAKKGILVKATLLMITLCAYVGSADNAWALEITLPTSIHDILTVEQVTEAKNSQTLRDIKNGMRGDVMTDQAARRPGAIMFLMSDTVGQAISNEVSSQTRDETRTAQMEAMSDPTSPDGMPVKIAPGPF